MTERAMNRTTTNSFACPLAIYNPFRNYPIKYLNFMKPRQWGMVRKCRDSEKPPTALRVKCIRP